MTRRYPASSKAVRKLLSGMDTWWRKPDVDAMDRGRFGELPAKAGDDDREAHGGGADGQGEAAEVRQREDDRPRRSRP